MLTRRNTVLGGALTLIWGHCSCARADAVDGTSAGCTLEPQEAERFLAIATEPQAFDNANETLIASTGNRELDFALAQTLSRLADTFGVLPGFSFFDDGNSPGAYATNVTRLRRADGTVLFGKRYFLNHMAGSENPEVLVTAVCAHEFGHIVQYKHNLLRFLNAGQPTVKRGELHADFFAGYFAGVRKLQKPDYPAAVFAASRFAVGDFVTSKSHHGTPDERAAAVIRGFETAYRERRNFSDAIQIGLNYASRL